MREICEFSVLYSNFSVCLKLFLRKTLSESKSARLNIIIISKIIWISIALIHQKYKDKQSLFLT